MRQVITILVTGLVVSVAVGMIATRVIAEDLRAPLTASVSFSTPKGAPLDSLETQAPFAISVRINNSLGADPPAGLTLAGWLRPVSPSNVGCAEAARSFLATGRLPSGAIKLNGPLIGVAGQEGSFVIADPDLDLASANLTGAATLAEVPISLTTDLDGGRFIATLADKGEVLGIEVPTAQVLVLAKGLSHPTRAFAAADRSVWVYEADASRVVRIVKAGDIQEVMGAATAFAPATAGDTVAIAGLKQSALYDSATAEPVVVVDAPSRFAVPVADWDQSFALALLGDRQIKLYYIDAPERPVNVALSSKVSKLAASPDGRWLLGYEPDTVAPVLLIDVARARVVQTISAGIPVSEIAFTDRAAYLMLADQSRVGVLDFSAINDETATPLRNVMLGQARDTLLKEPGYLAPLWPQPGMLAVHAESYTGFVIQDYSMMGDAPPMSALKLRGGFPKRIAAFDRSFREVEPGLFKTTAVLEHAGDYELVTTTGIGALSFCAPLPVMDGVTVAAPEPGYVTAERLAGKPARVQLKFLSDEGKPVSDGEFRVLVTSLVQPWRQVTIMHSDLSGTATMPLAIPADGPVVIAAGATSGGRFLPLVLED